LYKNIVTGLLLIVAASLAATPLRAAEPKNCQLKQYASLDLSELANGRLLVPVTLQGSRGSMIFNISNAFSTVTEDTVERLALQTGPVPLGAKVHSGGRPIDKMATVNGFSMGNVRFKSADLLVVSNDTVGANPDGLQVFGVLGMDVFSQFDLELDVANRKLNLFSPDHCPGQAVYWSDKYDSVPIRFGKLGEFYFPMELEGKKIETTLATGNPTTTLSTDVTRKLFNFDKNSPDMESETDPAGRTSVHYRAMKLSGEGLQIINAHIALIDRPQSACRLVSEAGAAAYDGCFGVHPLQLGRNVLAKLRIYIATKEKVLYFTLADAHK
jgi:hypothetical protein